MPSARLPIPGEDKGTWGAILNDFLAVSHDTSGNINANTIGTVQIQDSSVTTAKLAADAQDALKGSPAGTLNASLSATDTSVTNSRTPSGTAGGDLTGTYPNPTVAKLNGVALSGAAANGNALIATSATAASWAPTVTLDTSTIPHTLGTASPGTGTSGAAPSDHVHAMPALSQLTDQDMTNLADGTIPTWNAAAGKFKQAAPSVGAASLPLWQTLTAGIVTLPRTHQDDSSSYGSTPASGVEHFTYFRADKSMSVGHIQFQTGSVAAASSTYAAVGLYTVNAGTLTLVASSTNKTTFSGTYAGQVVALTSSYTVAAGTIYAVGMLQVASTPASVIGAWYNGAYLGSTPALAGTKSSQASLASTTSGLSTQQFPIYYELLA